MMDKQDEHRNGWNDEEFELALKQAEQNFNPASVGDSRVQDWKKWCAGTHSAKL
jgi:hypothetical protein